MQRRCDERSLRGRRKRGVLVNRLESRFQFASRRVAIAVGRRQKNAPISKHRRAFAHFVVSLCARRFPLTPLFAGPKQPRWIQHVHLRASVCVCVCDEAFRQARDNFEHRSSHTLVTADKMSFTPSRKFGTNARSRRRNQRKRARQVPKWPKNTKSVRLPNVRNPTRADDLLPVDFVETLAKTSDWRFLMWAEAVLDEIDEHVRNEKAQALMRDKKKRDEQRRKYRENRRQQRLWRKYMLAHNDRKHPPKQGQFYYKGRYSWCPLEPDLFCDCARALMDSSSDESSDEF